MSSALTPPICPLNPDHGYCPHSKKGCEWWEEDHAQCTVVGTRVALTQIARVLEIMHDESQH